MSKDKTILAAAPDKATTKLMKRLVKTYLKPYFKQLIGAIVLMAVAASATAIVAQLMQPILDDVLTGQKKELIVPIGLFIMGVFIVRGLSTYVHTVMMQKVGQSIVADIQKDLFTHFMRLDLGFFHNNPSGQLISRVISDVNVMRIATTDVLTGLGKSTLTLFFLIIVMFYQDWKLSLAAFVIFPFIAMFVAAIGRKLRIVSKNLQGELGNLSDRLSQTFQGIRQVQAYGMEKLEVKKSSQAIDKVKKLNIKTARIGNLSTPVNETLVGLVFFGIIIYGGYAASRGEMTAGQLGAFLTAFSLAYEPMKKLAKLNNTLQTGLGAAERVFDMMDLKPAIKTRSKAKTLKTKKPEIAFNQVDFQYEDTDLKALNKISFSIPSGKVIALVGSSGAGKSTVMNLIPRFYDVQGGEITINGENIKNLKLASLRDHIAFVSQDITIFDDTIGANIGYGRAGASEKDIIKAAKAAAAHDFISAFPQGYDTQVGEDGVKLSGGQRQRIAIARAILRDAPILLLDEATSALDNESEKLVQKALEKLQAGRTTLVIAHRLSTVQNADKILVMDKGEIVEQGKHSALLKKNGVYKKMYEAGLKE
jgi:subfamily B ATP-binding cassette protein MsbA